MDGTKNSANSLVRPGQQLGSYRLISIIEQGRFSGALLGEHVETKKQYVIDLLPAQLKGELFNTFFEQTRRIIKLKHPHILHVHSCGVKHQVPYLVIEYVPHITLRQCFSRGNPQPLDNLLPYIKQAAEGLHYAHDQKILHKHVRPENIVLGWDKEVLLTDFAIDIVDQNLQPRSEQDEVRRVAYMAPEHIQGAPGYGSDQYALAVIAYEWLCGDLPFHGSAAEISNQHIYAVPTPLRRYVPTISSAIEEVILMALNKDPRKRFATVQAFANALEQSYKVEAPSPRVQVARPSSRQSQHTPPRSFLSASGESIAAARPEPALPSPAAQVQPAQAVQSVQPAPVAPQQAFAQAMPVVQAANYQAPAPLSPQPAQQVVAPPIPPSVPAVPSPAPARRRKEASLSRRVFVVSLLGVAAVGGAAAWYRFAPHTSAPVVATTVQEPATMNDATGAKPQKTNALVYRGHPVRVNTLSWSPDGKFVASGGDDNLVQIFNAATGATVLTYRGHTREVHTVAWSPNGKLVASAGADKTVQVWNANDGHLVTTYRGHTDVVNTVAWSPDSKWIASGSDDKTLQAWNALTQDLFFTYAESTAGVLCAQWSPDFTSIVTGSWDSHVRAISLFNNDAFKVGQTIFDYKGHSAAVLAVTWSPDSAHIASAGADRVVHVGSSVNGNTSFLYKGHTDAVYSLSWSPSGRYIASAGADNTVQVWTLTPKQAAYTYRGHTNTVYSTEWSQDGRLASASGDTTVQVWKPF